MAAVRMIEPVRDPAWARLVGSRPSSVFHSPQWLRVLAGTYGYEVRARVLCDGAGPLAGLCFVECDDFLGRRIVSLPFSDSCDPLVADDRQWRALSGELFARRCRVDLRCLRTTIPCSDERLAPVHRGRWHAIDVARDLESVWRGLDGSARRALRKADAAGVRVRRTTAAADLRAFFDLHLCVRRRKYGLLAQPYRFFEQIHTHFLEPGDGVLVLAEVDGRTVAGCLFLEWQDTLYYKFNASDPAHLSARPNDRVLWDGIVHARDRGLAHIDLGFTDDGQDGLVRYKRKYATDEQTVWALRHLPPGVPAGRELEARHLLDGLTRLFVDEAVPDEVTERAGELLYRYFA